jgi:argininosuccinate synthase
VELELRRGDDYSILATEAEAATYSPDKLSMERSDTLFTPEDRIGALEMQTLSILDSRALLQHARAVEKAGAGLPLDIDVG